MASPPVTKPLGKECSNSLRAHLPNFQERPTDGKPNQQALVASLLKLWLTTSRVLSAPARSNSIVTGSADRSCLERVVREEDRFHAGLSRTPGKSVVRNRRSKSLSHRMRRRKL